MDLVKAFLPLIIILVAWFGVGIYYAKKVKKHKKSIIEDKTRPENCLTLTRGVEQVNYLRKYKIIIDGEKVDDIVSGETKHINVPPGNHNVSVKIDWCTSKLYSFNLKDGENLELECGANYNDYRCLYMHLLKPSNYIYVRQPNKSLNQDTSYAGAC